MALISDNGRPIGELVREIAGPPAAAGNYAASRILRLALAAGVSSELAFSVENPEHIACLIKGVYLDVTTPGQSSAALNIGVVASSSIAGSAVVSSGDIASANVINPTVTADRWEANGASSDAWLTGQIVTDGASSLAGAVFIEYIPLYTST